MFALVIGIIFGVVIAVMVGMLFVVIHDECFRRKVKTLP